MKPRAIILGAGREESGSDGVIPVPRCLLTDPFGQRVLDWILAAFRASSISDVTFVGGYSVEKIGELFPELNYIYNPDWDRTGVLASLYAARREFIGATVVSYADVVYQPDVCSKLIEQAGDTITIAVDSKWKARTPSATWNQSLRKNLVVLDGQHVKDVGFLPPTNSIDAEFVGLVYFSESFIPTLIQFFEEVYPLHYEKPFAQASDVRLGYLTDLLRYFIESGVRITAVDIGDAWAEMGEPEEFARFVLGTKAETLERLPHIIDSARFCTQQIYTLTQWCDDSPGVIEQIQKHFDGQPLAVRSSTANEDAWTHSNAGHYKSVLHVDSFNPEAVGTAIEEVVSSYGRDGEYPDIDHQFLVQEMVNDVLVSGVFFSRDLETGAPYYVVNYDDTSNRTDSVTSGSGNTLKTAYISRAHAEGRSIASIAGLLPALRDIEDTMSCTILDIEFAVNADQDVYILQVRPLVMDTPEEQSTDDDTRRQIEVIADYLTSRLGPSPYLFGKRTILADMPDWNPAEMIGVRPRPLAFSLYQQLITESTWRVARAQLGYHDATPAPLMMSVGGHPLIDVRCSFNSLLPENLEPSLKEKLVNYYVERLASHPELHDKIEFEICATAMDFTFSSHERRLKVAGFSDDEVETLRTALLNLTDIIVSGEVRPLSDLVAEIGTLAKRRADGLKQLQKISDIPRVISQMMGDCITYGTIPFSILARYAFIAYGLLRTLVAREVLTSEQEDSFLSSIQTVATELALDLEEMRLGNLDRSEFLARYGHLRPGTYDIGSERYDAAPEKYFPPVTSFHARNAQRRAAKKHMEFDEATIEKVATAIADTGFTFTPQQLFTFIRDSIAWRERAKLEFTKSVSEILLQVERLGSDYGFSTEELSYVDIKALCRWDAEASGIRLETYLAELVKHGRTSFESTRRIKVPHFLTSPDDLYSFMEESSRPNFVTMRSVCAESIEVNGEVSASDLNGKIVLLERADPGYDWIFVHGIAGLITQYGGAASHMTIRATEFGIPAAIGCGEALFKTLKSAGVIELDCIGKKVHAL